MTGDKNRRTMAAVMHQSGMSASPSVGGIRPAKLSEPTHSESTAVTCDSDPSHRPPAPDVYHIHTTFTVNGYMLPTRLHPCFLMPHVHNVSA